MIKLLIATGVYPPESGGPATYTKLLEERLPAFGVEVRVLPFRVVRHLPKIVRHIAYFLKCLHAAREADLVYALDTVSVGLPAMLAAKFAGKKFLVRVPGDYAWEQARQRFGVRAELDEFQNRLYGPVTEFLRAIQKSVVRGARAVVVPSEYMKRLVGGWGAKNIHRIYSSVHLPPPVKLPHERPEGFLVLSFGRRVPWKGFEALTQVVAREPGWKLKIFSELPYAEAMGWLKTADVYVNNSTYEGLSHQVAEAMALGTPVVATRVGGNPELVEDRVDGLLIAPKDDEALYAALKNIEQHKGEAQARAENARAKTKQFSIDVTIVTLVDLLKNL